MKVRDYTLEIARLMNLQKTVKKMAKLLEDANDDGLEEVEAQARLSIGELEIEITRRIEVIGNVEVG